MVRSRELGQNFLRNQRTAHRVVHLAGIDDGILCVDLGAGNGTLTGAALRRRGAVLAIEIDPRLVARLRERFAKEPRVTVVQGDLATAPVPESPFVIAANPPFGQSTLIARRWLLAPHFVSGALIVEKAFAGRISGTFGATKLSISFAPFIDLSIGPSVRPDEFEPRPSVATSIMLALRRTDPTLPWQNRFDYWRLVNYLFERGQHTVGEVLRPLSVPALGKVLRDSRVRDLTTESAIEIFRCLVAGGSSPRTKILEFENSLPASRRLMLGENVATTPQV